MIVFLLFKLTTDPFDCSDCHLTWLIRDNRRLLPAVYKGTCSNGTRFEDLNPNGYENCPVIILPAYNRHIIEQLKLFLLFLFQAFSCPLGYDGQFADPLNCSSYYICRAIVAYKSVNITAIIECLAHYSVVVVLTSFSVLDLLKDCPGGLVFNPDDNLCDVVENVPQCQFQ